MEWAGAAITAELLGHDVRVRQVARGEIARIDERVQTVQADLSTPEAAIAATEGASVIYHAGNVAYHLQVDLSHPVATAGSGTCPPTPRSPPTSRPPSG